MKLLEGNREGTIAGSEPAKLLRAHSKQRLGLACQPSRT